MSRMKGVSDCGADLEDDYLVQRAMRDSLLQGLTLEQLHDYEYLAIGRFSDVVDRADVRVLQCCHGLRFALEPLASSSRIAGMRHQQFDGHVSGKSLVTGPVDLAHATRSDGGDDLVRAEPGASLHADVEYQCTMRPDGAELQELPFVSPREAEALQAVFSGGSPFRQPRWVPPGTA
jgi:hypothetical protein